MLDHRNDLQIELAVSATLRAMAADPVALAHAANSREKEADADREEWDGIKRYIRETLDGPFTVILARLRDTLTKTERALPTADTDTQPVRELLHDLGADLDALQECGSDLYLEN